VVTNTQNSFCSSCASSLEIGAVFCGACGSRQVTQVMEDQVDPSGLNLGRINLQTDGQIDLVLVAGALLGIILVFLQYIAGFIAGNGASSFSDKDFWVYLIGMIISTAAVSFPSAIGVYGSIAKNQDPRFKFVLLAGGSLVTLRSISYLILANGGMPDRAFQKFFYIVGAILGLLGAGPLLIRSIRTIQQRQLSPLSDNNAVNALGIFAVGIALVATICTDSIALLRAAPSQWLFSWPSEWMQDVGGLFVVAVMASLMLFLLTDTDAWKTIFPVMAAGHVLSVIAQLVIWAFFSSGDWTSFSFFQVLLDVLFLATIAGIFVLKTTNRKLF
jgi:hypothetical protein